MTEIGVTNLFALFVRIVLTKAPFFFKKSY